MKKIVKGLLIGLGIVLLAAAGYCIFIICSYYRIGDAPLSVEGSKAQTEKVSLENQYKIVTYNIGFGAYDQDFDCVLDTSLVQNETGEWENVHGKHLKASSKESALQNTNGAAQTLAQTEAQFLFVQEVDTKSDRAWQVNQLAILQEQLSGRNSVFCCNFHVPFLPYPLNDMMGAANSGIVTFSRFTIQHAERYEFEVTSDLVSKLFDLDRCFSVSYVDIESGHQLVLVNVHMSAYDEGGLIRAKQREQLYSFIEAEYQNGNYVIVGGDYNHDLLTNNPAYPQYSGEEYAFKNQSTHKRAWDSVYFFDENKEAGLPEGFSVVASDNSATCRGGATVWQPGESLVYTLDGFLVSDNIEVMSHYNIATKTQEKEGFAYSDHDPAVMEFKLVKDGNE